MAINERCKYYKRKEIEVNETGNKNIDHQIPMSEHLCYHPANTKAMRLTVASKPCDTSNDFCLHKPTL